VRRTRHGPVISDVPGRTQALIDTGRYALALRWTALDADNHNVQATLASNRAGSVADLLAAYREFHAPMQNVVAADRSGRIAFKAVGKVPLRQPGNDIRGVAPAPGWEARYDWAGWLPYEQTPQDDGSKGWIATANQRIHGPAITITLGAGCILVASMLYFSVTQARLVIHELLITLFVLMTAPVVSMLIMRAAVYRDLRASRAHTAGRDAEDV
jgi:monovalent cation/proton antiporter MnhG/PhaG subunit